MKPETLTRFKARLEDQREELKGRLSVHGEDLREGGELPDIAGSDRAAEWEEREVGTRIVESEELLLEKIDHALDRIARGLYGLCESCGEAIPEARLDAKPSVALCLACQERKDLGA